MKALDNKCPYCGASVSFDPKKQLWHCDYCDSDLTKEDLNKRNSNASSDENNLKENNIEVDSYTCKSCGATLIADENTAATFCVYCGNTAILKNKLTGTYAPDYIIPFKNTKEEIVENFKSLQKGRILMPKFFNNPKNIEKITGVYIPFWLFDLKVKGEINFDATRVRSWTSGDYRYTETKIYELKRGVDINFNKIPADGSSHFDDELMQSLEPFKYDKLEKYNHAYLSGFLAEKYDVDKNTTFEIAKERANTSATSEARATCTGYSSVTKKNDSFEAQEIKTNYVLLPVWMLNVKFNSKNYIFAMNGQTGKIVGNIPVHKGKALLLWLVSFIGFMLICTLFWVVFIR